MQRMRKLLTDGQSFRTGGGEYFVVREAYGSFSFRAMSPSNETIAGVADCFGGFTFYNKRFAAIEIVASGPVYVDCVVSEYEIWPQVFDGDSSDYFSFGVYPGGLAANYSSVQLWNPATSNVLVKVEMAMLSYGSTALSLISRVDTTEFPVGATSRVDESDLIQHHFGDINISGCVAYAGYDTVAPNASNTVLNYNYLSANTGPISTLVKPVYLMPGYGLRLYAVATNVKPKINMTWREIKLS